MGKRPVCVVCTEAIRERDLRKTVPNRGVAHSSCYKRVWRTTSTAPSACAVGSKRKRSGAVAANSTSDYDINSAIGGDADHVLLSLSADAIVQQKVQEFGSNSSEIRAIDRIVNGHSGDVKAGAIVPVKGDGDANAHRTYSAVVLPAVRKGAAELTRNALHDRAVIVSDVLRMVSGPLQTEDDQRVLLDAVSKQINGGSATGATNQAISTEQLLGIKRHTG